ncbi:Uncharacterised protein [Klebsiella pneumoniae]|nr:Uncharacterised protein [Klebsiella pneumoniae]
MISFSSDFMVCLLLRRAGGLLAGNAAERRTDGHAHAGGIPLTQHVAGHHFAGDEQVAARLARKMDGGAFINVQPKVGKGDPRP